MLKKFSTFFTAMLALAGTTAFAQVKAPKYSNEFLNIGVGGRALGLGNVQSAIVTDATAGFWNPAGLTHLQQKHNLVGMQSEVSAGSLKNDYLSYATPLDTASALPVSVL